MFLVADSGSTKTTWCIIQDNEQKFFFNSEGYNPFFLTSEEIEVSLSKSIPDYLKPEEVEKIFFYGAGCSNANNLEILEKGLSPVFSNSKIYIGHDLLCASRALLKNKPGFAAILGTGSNTCLYDGKKITLCIDSLGFYLGDEGSGAHLGKKLLRDILRGYAPEHIEKKFRKKYETSNLDILNEVYHSNLRNRYCANFAKFISENYSDNEDYFNSILDSSFYEFFEFLVSRYPNYKSYAFNCIGSVGYTFRSRLSLIIDKFGMKVGKIIRSPIDDVVDYHLNYI